MMRQPMTREAFFAWAEAQEEHYEFDGSQPLTMPASNLGHSRCLISLGRIFAAIPPTPVCW
jgi:hypothetical protein